LAGALLRGEDASRRLRASSAAADRCLVLETGEAENRVQLDRVGAHLAVLEVPERHANYASASGASVPRQLAAPFRYA
jgi:hypothetical protein